MAKKTKDHVLLEEDFKRQQKMLKLGMKLQKLQDEVNGLVEDINRLALEPWQADVDGFLEDGNPPVEKLEQYRVIENDPCQIILDFLNDKFEDCEFLQQQLQLSEKIEAWLKNQKIMSSEV